MSLDVSKIPPHILKDLEKRGHTPERIAQMNAEEAFDEYLSWQGILGYGSMLRSAVHALDKAERSK